MKITDKEGRVQFVQDDDDPEPVTIEEMIERDINKKQITKSQDDKDKETIN